MRYCVLVTIFLSFASLLVAAPKNEGTPKVVKTLITNLETLTELSDNQRDDAYNIHLRNVGSFAASGSGGINIDSDDKFNSEFYYLGLEPVSKSVTYCIKLYSLLYKERALRLSHEILYTEAINAPDIDGKDELYFYDTKVKKTCTYNNEEKVIWQTFEVAASDGLIDKIEGFDSKPTDWRGGASSTSPITPNSQNNRQSGSTSHLDQSNKPYTLPSYETKQQTEQDLLRLAARYYTAKDYSSAATTLNTLTAKYPNNAEAWFRLALIVRYKTKWSKKVYKDPNKSAIEFMKKASALANGKLKSKADNALFYWEHPNYM